MRNPCDHKRVLCTVWRMSDARDSSKIPEHEKDIGEIPIHWFLARIGKSVLRPGGVKTTRWLLEKAHIEGKDVVELAPGMGKTAGEIIGLKPRSYTGVERDDTAANVVHDIVAPQGTCIKGDASATGLSESSADVVMGEAMLTLHDTRTKQAIIAEAHRILRPNGFYCIHELAFQPDDIDQATQQQVRADLARVMKVSPQPLAIREWRTLLESHDFEVTDLKVRPTRILQARRNIEDEGLRAYLKVLSKLRADPAAKERAAAMESACKKHADHVTGMAIVARKRA